MAVLVRFGLSSLLKIGSLPKLFGHITVLFKEQFDVDKDGVRFAKIFCIAMITPFMKRRIARWIKRRKTVSLR